MPKEFQIDARIDLHGHTLQNAYDAFADFMQICRANEFKNLLVVTGKSSGEQGTINYEFPRWCENEEYASIIKSLRQADEKFGGSGAFYVKLW